VRASSASSSAPVGAVRASRGFRCSHHEGRLRFGSGDVNSRCSVLIRRASRTTSATDASCRALPVEMLAHLILRGTKDRSTGSAPPPPFPDPKRLSSAGPRGPPPAGARGNVGGRHWSLGLAALVQLPTCVHPRASGLGPKPEPVIHRSASGRMPPDDFCNDVGCRSTTDDAQTPCVWRTIALG
jgi:hypothetical protein